MATIPMTLRQVELINFLTQHRLFEANQKKEEETKEGAQAATPSVAAGTRP